MNQSFYRNTKTYPFKHQPHKMVKHAQTIRRLVIDHFVGLALKDLK